jgi:hypothetical protein
VTGECDIVAREAERVVDVASEPRELSPVPQTEFSVDFTVPQTAFSPEATIAEAKGLVAGDCGVAVERLKFLLGGRPIQVYVQDTGEVVLLTARAMLL